MDDKLEFLVGKVDTDAERVCTHTQMFTLIAQITVGRFLTGGGFSPETGKRWE